MRSFLADTPLGVDAILISAEAGSAWTLLHPEYAVVVPEPHQKGSMALFLPKRDPDFTHLVADWIKLKKTDKAMDRLHQKWILGKDEESEQPRWSIARDLLGWKWQSARSDAPADYFSVFSGSVELSREQADDS